MTGFQFSTIQILWNLAHCRHDFLCAHVNRGIYLALWLLYPYYEVSFAKFAQKLKCVAQHCFLATSVLLRINLPVLDMSTFGDLDQWVFSLDYNLHAADSLPCLFFHSTFHCTVWYTKKSSSLFYIMPFWTPKKVLLWQSVTSSFRPI